MIEHVGQQKLRVFSSLIIQDEVDTSVFFDYPNGNLVGIHPPINPYTFNCVRKIIFDKSNSKKKIQSFEYGVLRFTLYNSRGEILSEYNTKGGKSSINLCKTIIKKIPKNEFREMLCGMFGYYIDMFEIKDFE